MNRYARYLVVIVILAIPVFPASADQRPNLSEEAIDRRLAFIEKRLNEGQPSARWWQHGWSGFFATSTVFQGYKAVESSDGDNEVNYTVGAVKSAAALTLMLMRPLPAVKGAAPVEAMPTGSPDKKEARLEAAEDLLQTNARRARERKSWKRHLTAIAVHLIGSGAIAVFGDGKDAVVSSITGIAISEAHIWSQPYRVIDDLTDYQQTFPKTPPGGLSWNLTPIKGGLGVTIRF